MVITASAFVCPEGRWIRTTKLYEIYSWGTSAFLAGTRLNSVCSFQLEILGRILISWKPSFQKYIIKGGDTSIFLDYLHSGHHGYNSAICTFIKMWLYDKEITKYISIRNDPWRP